MALGRSISLAAYMAMARRGPKQLIDFPREKPEETIVWGHATSPARAASLLQIGARLHASRPEITLLLTTPPDMQVPEHLRDYVIWQSLPDDTVSNSEAFLAHWEPAICLWTGGFLRPALIHCAAKQDLPLFLIDVDEDGFNGSRWRWMPDLVRANLNDFSAIMVRSGTAVQMLRRMGVPETDVTFTGPLQEGGSALKCNEQEREEMALAFAGRPVWLAAMAQLSEVETLLKAHRKSSRKAHRLLLILVPDNEAQGSDFLEVLKQEGLRVAVWSEGEIPDETTQVFLADTHGDMGLWYRLAPVCFMASSLVPGYGGRDPFEPAALGSAILYGPNVSRYLSAYTRFANAGAARIVKDFNTLSAAISNLVAPDQAALMAVAAWGVESEGAEVTDQIIELVQDTLDVLEAADARA